MSDPSYFIFKYKIFSILCSITTLVIFWILTSLCMVTWRKSGRQCSDVTHGTKDECKYFNRDKRVIVVINN